MKKIIWAAGIAVLMAGVAQATVINFTDVDPDKGTVNVGTLTAGQTLGDGGEFSSLSYTVSGLDIEEDGSANDSITVAFNVAALGTGTPVLNWDVIEIDHNGGVFGAGDGIAFGTIGVTGTLGTSGDALVVNSAVYTDLLFRRWHEGDSVTISGDVTTGTVAWNTMSASLDDTYFSMTSAVGTGTWQVDDFAFTVDAIPEPAALGLIAMAGVSMLFIRRLMM